MTLVEVMVALVFLGLTAAAVTEALIQAQHRQFESGRWMRAAVLAEQAAERARLTCTSGADVIGELRRSWTCSTIAEPALRIIEVAVEWEQYGPQRLALRTAARP